MFKKYNYVFLKKFEKKENTVYTQALNLVVVGFLHISKVCEIFFIVIDLILSLFL